METDKKHDFNEPIEITATGLAKIVIEKLNDNKDVVLYEMGKKRTKEEQKKIDEAFLDMAISLVQTFSVTDLPADYAGLPVDKAIAILTVLKNYIEGTIRKTEDELLSRIYGARSPRTGTFAKDVVTIGQMMTKLQEVKIATGNKDEDYCLPGKEE